MTSTVRYSVIIVILTTFAVSCAVFPRNQFRPVEKGENWRVRLTKFESGSDLTTKGHFDHPHHFTLIELNRILGAVHYEDADVFGKAKKIPVFTGKVRARLLEPLKKAFEMARSDEVVDFSFMLKEQVLVLFSNDFFTSGIMFVEDGRLNIVFRTINLKGINYSEAIRQFVGDPTNRPIANPWRLVPGPGMSLKEAPRSSFSLFQQPYYTNWLVVDLSHEFEPAPLKRRRRRVRQPVQELTPRSEPPAIRFEAPGNYSAPVQHRGARGIDDPEVRRRLQILRELYNSGEISRSTYERKKEELLSP